jgi:tetratricopeptide (TPR) repeat protein
VIDLVNRYQIGNAEVKQGAIKELFEMGSPGCAALLKIATAESNPQLRQQLFAQIGREASRAVPGLLAEGNFAALENLLELSVAAEADAALPSYTCFLLLRGRLDEKIAALKLRSAGPEGKRSLGVLALLYRAKGDLAAAREAAEKAGKIDLLEAILYEQGDWKALAQRPTLTHADSEIETLGFQAAYQRLSGDQEAFAKTGARIRQMGEDLTKGDAFLWYCAKALFLNDQPQEALALLQNSKRHPHILFKLLCTQLKYREALAMAEELQKTSGPRKFSLDIQRGRAHFLLGEKDQALSIFKELAGSGPQSQWNSEYPSLLEEEYRLGLVELARESCARFLATARNPASQEGLLGKVFPRQAAVALPLWQFLRQKHAGEEALSVMKRLAALMDNKVPLKDFEALVRDAESQTGMKVEERVTLLVAAAEAALAAGHTALGRQSLEKTVQTGGSASGLMRLGDDLAEHKQWKEAAEHYAKAWERAPNDPLPLFLRGHALLQAGLEKEGKKWQELAHLLPLGNEAVRHTFATALLRRGRRQAAQHEFLLLRRTATPGSFYIGESLRQGAFTALADKDYLQAADLHERSMLRCLDTSVAFLDNGAYLAVPHIIHRYRARGLALAGRLDKALLEMQRCEASLPGDGEVPIALVPELEKRGRKKEAEELFRRCFQFHEALCRDYPRSAAEHNSLAWLAACCRRELDKALEHTLKAVELSPSSPGYLDTLGEVYFQRGDKDKALAAARKCLEMDPKNAYYRKQLKRIEAGDRLAELPASGEEE